MSEHAAGDVRVGRPRDPSVERRVLDAARQELAEHGIDGFSVRGVGRRAGASRASLALRWPDADSLIIDALDDINDQGEIEPTGSLRGDLIALTDQMADALDSPLIELQLRLMADARRRPDLLSRFQDRVMRTEFVRLRDAVQRSVRSGELPTGVDVDLFVTTVIGVVFLRTMASAGRTPPARTARAATVDSIIALFTPATPASSGTTPTGRRAR